MSFDYAIAIRPFKAPKKCPNCKKKGHMEARMEAAWNTIDNYELWMQVPYYWCGKCKTGVYDYRAHLMETTVVTWIAEPDEERTWH